MLAYWTLLAVSSLASCSSDSPLDPEPTLGEELQLVLDNALEENDGIGVSVSIITDSGEIWNTASGISHGTISLTANMMFNVASVTKTFTAATILQLMEDGILTLEDQLHEWLPDFPNIDSTITIRQLLDHTSGIFDLWDYPDLFDSITADYSRIWSPIETIEAFTLSPYSSPGEEYHYSNNNYILLGMIIQEATGSEVSTEIRSRFLEPLGLANTYLAVEEVVPNNIAHGWYDLDGDDSLDDLMTVSWNAYYSIDWTAGSMFSTPEDIARWSQALFQGGILNPTTLDEMQAFRAHSIPGNATAGYGLGVSVLYLDAFNNAEARGHGGEGPGYRGMMAYLPEHGYHLSIWLNEASGELFWDVIDAVGGVLIAD